MNKQRRFYFTYSAESQKLVKHCEAEKQFKLIIGINRYNGLPKSLFNKRSGINCIFIRSLIVKCH